MESLVFAGDSWSEYQPWYLSSTVVLPEGPQSEKNASVPCRKRFSACRAVNSVLQTSAASFLHWESAGQKPLLAGEKSVSGN